jgi:hypothetical protein
LRGYAAVHENSKYCAFGTNVSNRNQSVLNAVKADLPFLQALGAAGGNTSTFETWSIGGIHFDQGGLTAGTASSSAMSWMSDGASIELTTSRARVDLNGNVVARLRDEERRLASANGRGLVSARAPRGPCTGRKSCSRLAGDPEFGADSRHLHALEQAGDKPERC